MKFCIAFLQMASAGLKSKDNFISDGMSSSCFASMKGNMTLYFILVQPFFPGKSFKASSGTTLAASEMYNSALI